MGPPPTTATRSPGWMPAVRTPCHATDAVSISDASSTPTPSGSATSVSAGTRT